MIMMTTVTKMTKHKGIWSTRMCGEAFERVKQDSAAIAMTIMINYDRDDANDVNDERLQSL